MTDFTALGLGERTLRALAELDFTEATPIQSQAIPLLISGSDLIGVAQTGSGKTAAFVLPLIESMAARSERAKPTMPRAVILAPTRELAQQISGAIRDFSKGQRVTHCVVLGGAPFKTQSHILQRGVDIVVATPGRLMDHIKRGNIYLDEVEHFILDEADRMLDMGFIGDVKFIAKKLPDIYQSVMFSATFGEEIKALASDILTEPEYIEVARQATIAENLTHKILYVPRDRKRDALLYLIEREGVRRALIFTRTRGQADELADFLADLGFSAKAIHGDKPQRMRERILKQFKTDKISLLVATDVAARGIDVPDISHVFNTDVPLDAENYVHRIGRTARGGATGAAFTLCDKAEFRLVRAIEKVIKQAIETEADHPFPLEVKKNKPVSRKRATTGPRPKPGKKMPAGKKKSLARKRKSSEAKIKAAGPAQPAGKKSASGKSAPNKSTPNKSGPNKSETPQRQKTRHSGAKKAGDTAPRRASDGAKKATARKPAKRATRSTGGNRPLKRR